MKTLFIGGVKSGKSRLAEAHILMQAQGRKPYYIATNECFDAEMQRRVAEHKQRRGTQFDTIEEPIALVDCIIMLEKRPVLVECVTLWLNNMLYHHYTDQLILEQIEQLMALPHEIVLVQNEVGLGIIPDNALARRFVDLSGQVAQRIAAGCEQVFFCSAGLLMAMKP